MVFKINLYILKNDENLTKPLINPHGLHGDVGRHISCVLLTDPQQPVEAEYSHPEALIDD
jgi:hypothetical protein